MVMNDKPYLIVLLKGWVQIILTISYFSLATSVLSLSSVNIRTLVKLEPFRLSIGLKNEEATKMVLNSPVLAKRLTKTSINADPLFPISIDFITDDFDN